MRKVKTFNLYICFKTGLLRKITKVVTLIYDGGFIQYRRLDTDFNSIDVKLTKWIEVR